jgi:hypothetical protein
MGQAPHFFYSFSFLPAARILYPPGRDRFKETDIIKGIASQTAGSGGDAQPFFLNSTK